MDASPGAELWAWFNAENRTDTQIDEQWKELCGVLSGLFCASLSFIDATNTVQPEFTFRPTFSSGIGVGSESTVNTKKHKIRYATLPNEIVCTENLTPWKKLLPCHQHEGFVSLLQSGYIHSTNYHSLGLHVRRLSQKPIKETAGKVRSSLELMEIRQTVNLVFDKQIVSTNGDWSMRKMFGRGLNGASELAEISRIYVDVSENDFRLTPSPTNTIISQRGGITTQLALYDVKKDFSHQMFNIAAVYESTDGTENRLAITLVLPPPLYAKRYLLGVGQERGKIVTKITNSHWAAVNVVLQENLPWYVPIYLHTLTIKVRNINQKIEPNAIKYIPGRLRERPSHLEIAFKCPSRSTIDVSIDFDYVFLKWLEYPPDANHGHYIGSAILAAQLPIARNYTAIPIDGHLFADSFNASRSAGYLVNIRTESLLISLPTPDFSMPYNVICLACTVVALAFGPIHNLSTKKLMYGKKINGDNNEAPTTILGKIKKLLKFGRRT